MEMCICGINGNIDLILMEILLFSNNEIFLVLMEMCICGKFSYPPITIPDQMERDAIIRKEIAFNDVSLHK